MSRSWQKISLNPFFIRLLHWEYWSFGFVYFWIYPIWFYYCLRAGSLFFFNASNPRIKNGGFLAESKKDIYFSVTQGLLPDSLFFTPETSAEELTGRLRAANMNFPLIAKPDIGGRGRGVKKLTNEKELLHYLENCPLDFHIQPFIELPQEIGLFYYRMPDQKCGNISGIVGKEFLQIVGNGFDSIETLINKDRRAILQKDFLQRAYGPELQHILPAGETKLLVPYGNHARGAKFIDLSSKISPALIQQMDKICKQIGEFHFGRLDIRFRSWETLEQGKEYCIIEINGAGSEPTHIYDPGHSIFFAWKEIVRHWHLLYRISRANHQRGFPYLSFKEGLAMFRENRRQSRQLATFGSCI